MSYGDGTQYGDGTEYGPSTPPGASTSSATGEVAWIVNVKWNGTDPVNEAVNLVDCEIFRGSEYYIPVNGNGLETFGPGKATLTFIDTDRRWDEYNTASPIYPYAVPGRPVEILVHTFATGVTESLLTGFITSIDPITNDNLVKVIVEDELRALQDVKYKAGVLYNQTVTSSIQAVLANTGYTKPKNIMYTNQPVYVFDPREEAALDIINELASAALGTFWCDRFGKAIFQPLSQQSAVIHDLDQSQLRKEISFPKSWETVRNHIKLRVNRRGKRPGSVIWTMPGVHYFSTSTPGEPVEYSATWDKTSTPAQPIGHADYYANSQADGNGTDVTDDYTVTLSEITSTGCLVRVTRTSGNPGYLLGLRITGNEIVNAPHNIIGDADILTINFYRPRDFEMDNPYMQDSTFTRSYAGTLKVFLSVPHRNATVQIQQRPEIQYNKDLMERVHLTAAARDLDHTNTIRGIRHQWQDDTGQNVITTLYLQDMIYDPTVLDPEPFIPGAIEVPTIPSPNIPVFDPISLPEIPFEPIGTPLDPTNFCLMTDAPTNGAYYATPTVKRLINDGSGVLESFIWYACTLRPGSCVNKSQLKIWGGWAYWNESNIQTYDIGNTWWHVDAIAADGRVLCSGVIQEEGRTSPRTVVFSPATAMEVAGFRIWIDPLAAYTAGVQISTGTIPVADENGTTVSGLTVGQYYSLEATGGPWTYSVNPAYWSYTMQIKPASTWRTVGGLMHQGYEAAVVTGDLLAAGRINLGNYARGFFKASATSCGARAHDIGGTIDWYDNGGSLSYILRSARLAGKKCLVLDNAGIKNVCGSGIL